MDYQAPEDQFEEYSNSIPANEQPDDVTMQPTAGDAQMAAAGQRQPQNLVFEQTDFTTGRRITITVKTEPETRKAEGKPDFYIYPTYIDEVVKNVRMPRRFADMHIAYNKEDPSQAEFMYLTAPVRKLDEQGMPMTRIRRDANGQMLDRRGQPTNSARDASRTWEYASYEEDGKSKLLYSTLATINVKNERVHGGPTAFTMLAVKMFSDQQMHSTEVNNYYIRSLQEDDPRLAEFQEDNRAIRESAPVHYMFINSGHDFLRELKFNIRERAVERQYSNDFNPQP